MRINRRDNKTSAFVLKWTDIEKFISNVSIHLPNIKIRASCNDSLNRNFSDITELKTFSNAKNSAITELDMVFRDENSSQRFEITLNNNENNNVRVSIDADELTAISLNTVYEDFIDSVKPWYSKIAQTNFFILIMGLFFLLVLTILAIGAFYTTSNTESLKLDAHQMQLRDLRGFFVGMIPMLIGSLLNRFKNRVFPIGTFAFGDGENRHSQCDVIRLGVIVAFVVSTASSLFLSVF